MRERKNQAALEYLIIIAAVIAVSAIVVLFVTGSFGTQKSKMSIAQCKQAAADCKMNNLISNDPCIACESACVGPDGRDLMTGVLGCDANGACGLCKQGKATAIYETSCSDLDNDGYAGNVSGCSIGTDCNDSNASINPGAVENCSNGVDDDCDGLIDCADSDCSPNAGFEVTECSSSLGSPTTVTFDAGSSTTPTGSITSYYWDFGDDATATVLYPLTTHDYLPPPTIYSVNLTLTNDVGCQDSVVKDVDIVACTAT